MSKNQILEKISKKFNSAPSSEEDIVYTLSRIRKVLEIHNSSEKFGILLFYCNLALHSKIDRKQPKVVEDMLVRFHKGDDLGDSIINFIDLHRQLIEFSIEYGLPNWRDNYKINEFNKILSSIYSDTPITLRRFDFEITIDENGCIGGRQISS